VRLSRASATGTRRSPGGPERERGPFAFSAWWCAEHAATRTPGGPSRGAWAFGLWPLAFGLWPRAARARARARTIASFLELLELPELPENDS
jgi:hypothetical protein